MPRARRSLVTILAALLAALALAVPTAAAPGALDTSFGDDGVLSLAGDLPWTGGDGGFRGVDVLADGDLAVSVVEPCGAACRVGVLWRADATGAPAGQLRHLVADAGAPRLTGRVVRPDGGLVLSYDDPDGTSRVRAVTPAGEALDAPLPRPLSARAVSGDGAILLVGGGEVVRLQRDLSPDPGFGDGGAAAFPAGIPASADVAVAADRGGVRVAAAEGGAVLLGRLDDAGHDLGASRLPVPGASAASGAGVEQVLGGPGGETYVVARGELPDATGAPVTRTAVAAFDREGAADPSFGRDGVVALPEGDARVVVDPAGRLVVAASRPAAGGAMSVVLRRLTPAGRADPAFAAGPVATPATRLAGLDVALDREGRILVAADAVVPGRAAGVMLGRFLGGEATPGDPATPQEPVDTVGRAPADCRPSRGGAHGPCLTTGP